MNNEKKVLIFANSSWYLYNFWLNNLFLFQSSGYKVILMSNDDGFGAMLKEQGFEFHALSVSRGVNGLFGDIRLIFKLKTIIKDLNPDIIHNLNPKPVLYGSILSLLIQTFSNQKKIMIINSFPGLGRLYSDGFALYSFLRLIFENIYRVISKSSQVKSVFQVSSDRDYFLNKKIISRQSSYVIKGSGVDIDNFYSNNKSRKKNQLRILMASRITAEKGVHVYLAACRELNIRYSDISFFLAGKTDDNEPDLISHEELIESCHESGVNYLGHVSNMSELLRTIDIVVLPTNRREGVPRILVEAAASGVSLIATNIGGCADIVQHNLNGFIINQNSEEDIVVAIEKFVENNELLTQFGLASREIVRNEMNSKYVASEYINIYKLIN
jgi:glycosyltransferase involved in cell wall biosynthesis